MDAAVIKIAALAPVPLYSEKLTYLFVFVIIIIQFA